MGILALCPILHLYGLVSLTTVSSLSLSLTNTFGPLFPIRTTITNFLLFEIVARRYDMN